MSPYEYIVERKNGIMHEYKVMVRKICSRIVNILLGMQIKYMCLFLLCLFLSFIVILFCYLPSFFIVVSASLFLSSASSSLFFWQYGLI
jgi:hypothetical protein